jgi:cytochrome c oxidase subunit 4
MSTTTNVESPGIEPPAEPRVLVVDNPEEEHYVEHHSDAFYVKIAVILALITGLEVALSYNHIGVLFLPVLLTLMAIKFVMVVLFFMHLRFDSKWFNFAFWTGVILAIGVYSGALATFKFFIE